jgi:hypothetical protein
MRSSARPIHLLAVLVAATSIGCGEIELPITLALTGDNTISLEIPLFPPPNNVFTSTILGGAEATVIVDLNPFELFSPEGLVANILVDRVLIAGTNIDIFTLHTGTICVYDDPDNPGGGMAFLRPLHHEGDFHLTLNTLISPTDEVILGLFPDPLPFSAAIDETVPLTLADLFGLLLGSGGGLELHQELEATLPEDIPILGNSIVRADITLATADAFPADPLLDECEDFLAGP